MRVWSKLAGVLDAKTKHQDGKLPLEDLAVSHSNCSGDPYRLADVHVFAIAGETPTGLSGAKSAFIGATEFSNGIVQETIRRLRDAVRAID